MLVTGFVSVASIGILIGRDRTLTSLSIGSIPSSVFGSLQCVSTHCIVVTRFVPMDPLWFLTGCRLKRHASYIDVIRGVTLVMTPVSGTIGTISAIELLK